MLSATADLSHISASVGGGDILSRTSSVVSFEAPFLDEGSVTMAEALTAAWAGLCISFIREAYELPRLGSLPGLAGVVAGVVACAPSEFEKPI